MKTISFRRKGILRLAAAVILSAIFALLPLCCYAAEPFDHNMDYISIRRSLKDGRELVMCGISSDKEDDFVKEFESSYSSDSSYKFVNAAFVDAEKYDCEETLPFEPQYDSALCWAGSISNMLWMSGWARGLTDPLNSRSFNSEDDVFSYYNCRFINKGGDAYAGLEFFFEGLYYGQPGATQLCIPGDRSQIGYQIASDGLLRDYAAARLCSYYDLVRAPEEISQLEKICSSNNQDCVFQASIGDMDYEDSSHSVNVVGILIDPAAADFGSRYIGILIANTDNDAHPSAAMAEIPEPTDTQREADKADRDNSYSYYPLRYTDSPQGEKCWELLDYSEEERTRLFNITSLRCKTDEAVQEALETEGSRNSLESVDLTLDSVFTTSSTEAVKLSDNYASPEFKEEFKEGEAINLNYEVQNRSSVALDSNYTEEQNIRIEYRLTRKGSGTVKEGSISYKLPLASTTGEAFVLCLNAEKTDATTPTESVNAAATNESITVATTNENINSAAGLESWPVGEYELSMEINSEHEGSRSISEAYYRNNDMASCSFIISKAGSDTPSGKSEKSKVVDSGDSNRLYFYIVVELLAVIGIILPIIERKRRRTES